MQSNFKKNLSKINSKYASTDSAETMASRKLKVEEPQSLLLEMLVNKKKPSSFQNLIYMGKLA